MLFLNYKRGPLSLGWQTQFQDKQALRSVEIETFETQFGPAGIADSVFIHDLNASYDFSDRIQVYGGVNNITDREPFYYGKCVSGLTVWPLLLRWCELPHVSARSLATTKNPAGSPAGFLFIDCFLSGRLAADLFAQLPDQRIDAGLSAAIIGDDGFELALLFNSKPYPISSSVENRHITVAVAINAPMNGHVSKSAARFLH